MPGRSYSRSRSRSPDSSSPGARNSNRRSLSPIGRNKRRSPSPYRGRRSPSPAVRNNRRSRSRSPYMRGRGRRNSSPNVRDVRRSPSPNKRERGNKSRSPPMRRRSRSPSLRGRSPPVRRRSPSPRYRNRSPPRYRRSPPRDYGYRPPPHMYNEDHRYYPEHLPPPPRGQYDRSGYNDPYHARGAPPPLPPQREMSRDHNRRHNDGISLLVRNLANDVKIEDLKHIFGRIGQIKDVYIPKEYHSNKPKSFAFVEMANMRLAVEARDELDKFRLKGRQLEVIFAQEKRKTPNEMRGRGDRGRDRSPSYDRHRRRESRR